jgi:Amt family ammonium transporter
MSASGSWLVCAALALLMQAGFALVNTGLCRAKNASQVAAANLMILLCALLAFWICGFALMSGSAGGESHGFFFSPPEKDHHAVALFVIGAVLVAVAAVIPAGALAERWSLRNIVLYGFFAGALPIALYGRWLWSGGWLARLGQTLDLGHGAIDLAGAGVIHMAGGAMALAGVIVLGPRAGKYAREWAPAPHARPQPHLCRRGHHGPFRGLAWIQRRLGQS